MNNSKTSQICLTFTHSSITIPKVLFIKNRKKKYTQRSEISELNDNIKEKCEDQSRKKRARRKKKKYLKKSIYNWDVYLRFEWSIYVKFSKMTECIYKNELVFTLIQFPFFQPCEFERFRLYEESVFFFCYFYENYRTNLISKCVSLLFFWILNCLMKITIIVSEITQKWISHVDFSWKTKCKNTFSYIPFRSKSITYTPLI